MCRAKARRYLRLRPGRQGKEQRHRQNEKCQRSAESHGHLARLAWTEKNRWGDYTEKGQARREPLRSATLDCGVRGSSPAKAANRKDRRLPLGWGVGPGKAADLNGGGALRLLLPRSQGQRKNYGYDGWVKSFLFKVPPVGVAGRSRRELPTVQIGGEGCRSSRNQARG